MPGIADSSITANLRRLVFLRGCLILGELFALGAAVLVLGMVLPIAPLLTIEVFYLGITVLTWRWLRRTGTVARKAFLAQVAIDVLALTALLYFSGGSTNPFVFLFLLPVLIVAAALPKVYAWAMAGLTLACYTLLMFVYIPLPHATIRENTDFDVHVLGMWLGFLFSLLLILVFVLKMADNLRRRDQALSELRERALRDEQVIALGTFAAGTAHELGTPLSTIALLAEDITDRTDDAEVIDQLKLLRKQVRRCKEILTQLSVRVGELRADSGRVFRLDDYLQDLLANWHADFPRTRLRHHWTGQGTPPYIVADNTISQAIINVLNNAVEASAEEVEFDAHWNKDTLQLEICDHGAGLSPEAESLAGNMIYSGKKDGYGLGLFLTRSVLARFGGSLQFLQRQNGGTCARLTLPLNRLSAIAPTP